MLTANAAHLARFTQNPFREIEPLLGLREFMLETLDRSLQCFEPCCGVGG